MGFFRKLMRNNTVHLRAVCPRCGGTMKYQKEISFKGGKKVYDEWLCKNCHLHLPKDKIKPKNFYHA